jgi:glycosyltransferase involved in cell wall biosynthesis
MAVNKIMIINVIDPALRLTAGHHLDLGASMVRELRRAGHDVHVYCHAEITDDAARVLRTEAPCTPLFSLTPYGEMSAAQTAKHEIAQFKQTAATVAAELRRVRAAEAWLWPSIFASHVHACALLQPGVPIAGCVQVEPHYLSKIGPQLWSLALEETRRIGLRVGLGANEPMLCDRYRPLVAPGTFAQFPVPYDRFRAPLKRDRLKKIGFFGNQRDEKGVFLMERLIAQLLDDDFTIVLHDSSGGSSGSGDDRFRMIFGYVDDLAQEIADCDAVVTPYDPNSYRLKGSAIIWTALANGVPVIAPRDTAPGAWIERAGSGVTFGEFTAQSVFASVVEARNNYPAIEQRARIASARWVEEHGNQKFVEAMLKAL